MKTVRLGNVLGSSGSVAPLFAQQIRRGGPVTVTHPDATRYFLSLEDAIAALLLATSCTYPAGLYPARVDTPYRIEDLARFLISRRPSTAEPIEILNTGLRPGDKLDEQMTSARESVIAAPGERVLLQLEGPSLSQPELTGYLARLRAAIAARDLGHLLDALTAAMPEYLPSQQLRARAQTFQARTR